MLLKLGYQQRIFYTNSPPKRNAGSPQKRLMKQHSEGSLEAEAGDVSILKMETEHSSKPVPANFSTGSAGPAAPRLFGTGNSKRVKRIPQATWVRVHSRQESQISSSPPHWISALSTSARPTMQRPPAENKEHLGGPS